MEDRNRSDHARQKLTVLPAAPSQPPCTPNLQPFEPESATWRAIATAAVDTVRPPQARCAS
jgi:hypothetical protein